MSNEKTVPDNTAVRVALWRALHVLVDAPPHVIDDTVGLRLVDPEDGWRDRGDMHPMGTRPFRASIVARARFIEDLVAEQADNGVTQYVLLGAGLDTLAQRRPELASRLQIFDIDQPETIAWKRQRLIDLGYNVPDYLHLVPFNFEAGDDWWDALLAAGFDTSKPAVVTSTGVSMYITKQATADTLRRLSQLAPGSSVAMTFLLTKELLRPEDRAGLEMSARGAAASGTPFISFYTPEEIVTMARDAGFKDVRHVSGLSLGDRYFGGRADGMYPSSGEDLIVATT